MTSGERNMREKVAEILSTLLGREIAPGEECSMESERAWDSMKHIEIILTVEEETGVSFEAEEIPKLTSMARIVARLEDGGQA